MRARPGLALLTGAAALFCGATLAFAGEGARTIRFAGRSWEVRDSGGERQGPGGNLFSASKDNVWVDKRGYLHLRLTKDDSTDPPTWRCPEVTAAQAAGYGEYRFFIAGRLDKLDQNVIFSPFLYKDDTHEIDIEFSTWGKAGDPNNAQYVVQPYQAPPGHLHRFPVVMNGTYSTHYFDWEEDTVSFGSVDGHYSAKDQPNATQEYEYSGDDLPKTSDEPRVHINIWLLKAQPPTDGHEVEIVITGATLPPALGR